MTRLRRHWVSLHSEKLPFEYITEGALANELQILKTSFHGTIHPHMDLLGILIVFHRCKPWTPWKNSHYFNSAPNPSNDETCARGRCSFSPKSHPRYNVRFAEDPLYSRLLLSLLLWLPVTNVAALHTLSSSPVHYFSISTPGSTSYQIVPLNPKPLLQTLELRF